MRSVRVKIVACIIGRGQDKISIDQTNTFYFPYKYCITKTANVNQESLKM